MDESTLFWIKGNESSGIAVNNKRIEVFHNWHLEKVTREKELWNMFIFSVLRNMASHFSRAGYLCACLNMNRNGQLAFRPECPSWVGRNYRDATLHPVSTSAV